MYATTQRKCVFDERKSVNLMVAQMHNEAVSLLLGTALK